MRHGVPRRVGVERHARRLPAVAADRRLDPAPPRLWATADERLVATLEISPAHEVAQAAVGLFVARDDQQA